jgi:hypothetical protein
MHRYREFGLVSDQDELLRRAFRDGFKGAGLSFPRFLEALAWYRDHARPGADEAQLAEAFAAFADDRGWPAEHRDGAVDIYRAIRDNGPTAMIDAPPSPDADRAVIARSDDLLRQDPARYWRDAEFQDAVFEARERLGGGARTDHASMAPRESQADRHRVQEIETLLHDPSGAGQRRYWNDAALQADYTQALARLHDGAGSAESAKGPVAAIAADAPVAPIGQAPDRASA